MNARAKFNELAQLGSLQPTDYPTVVRNGKYFLANSGEHCWEGKTKNEAVDGCLEELFKALKLTVPVTGVKKARSEFLDAGGVIHYNIVQDKAVCIVQLEISQKGKYLGKHEFRTQHFHDISGLVKQHVQQYLDKV